MSEVRQEGYAGAVSEDALGRGGEDPAPGPMALGRRESGPDQPGEMPAASVLQATIPRGSRAKSAGPEDPGPEAGAGLVPDETAEDVEPMDGTDLDSSGET